MRGRRLRNLLCNACHDSATSSRFRAGARRTSCAMRSNTDTRASSAKIGRSVLRSRIAVIQSARSFLMDFFVVEMSIASFKSAGCDLPRKA